MSISTITPTLVSESFIFSGPTWNASSSNLTQAMQDRYNNLASEARSVGILDIPPMTEAGLETLQSLIDQFQQRTLQSAPSSYATYNNQGQLNETASNGNVSLAV